MAFLEATVQGRSEPLRDYIERFNKEAVQVQGADDNMKQYLITRGLREGTDAKKVVRLDHPETYNQLLAIVKTYIHYEEVVYAKRLSKARKEEPATEFSRKPFHEKKKEGKAPREGKGPGGRFTEYIPLSISREEIFAEISVAELKGWGQAPEGSFTGKEGGRQNKILSVPQMSRPHD